MPNSVNWIAVLMAIMALAAVPITANIRGCKQSQNDLVVYQTPAKENVKVVEKIKDGKVVERTTETILERKQPNNKPTGYVSLGVGTNDFTGVNVGSLGVGYYITDGVAVGARGFVIGNEKAVAVELTINF